MAVEVGVTELRENLAHWIDRAANGEDVLITDRGSPRALLTRSTGHALLDQLVREGLADPPTHPRRPLPPPIPVEGNPGTDELFRQRHSREY